MDWTVIQSNTMVQVQYVQAFICVRTYSTPFKPGCHGSSELAGTGIQTHTPHYQQYVLLHALTLSQNTTHSTSLTSLHSHTTSLTQSHPHPTSLHHTLTPHHSLHTPLPHITPCPPCASLPLTLWLNETDPCPSREPSMSALMSFMMSCVDSSRMLQGTRSLS